jgi:hypothetical protein
MSRPLAGRQWREAAKRPVLRLPRQPVARTPAAPKATVQALPKVTSRSEAAREMARRIADRYVTRDGRVLKQWR